MPTNAATVKSYLDSALLQLAAESYMHGINLARQDIDDEKVKIIRRLKYGFNDPTHDFIKQKAGVTGDADIATESQTTGSNSPVLSAYNRMVEEQAREFVSQYEIVDHHANDSTGFSATLFKNKDTGAYTFSMRSTEYRPSEIAGDGERDLFGTSRQGIADKGFAFDQLASMEDYWSHISNGERWNNDTQAWVSDGGGGKLAAFKESLTSNKINLTTRGAGSGLANCIKMFVKGFGESGGLSRTFFETGESMTDSRDIAPEGLGKGCKRSGFGPERKPCRERTCFGGQTRAAGGEQRFLGQPVAAARIGKDFFHWRRAMSNRRGFQNPFNEILLANDPGVGVSAIECFVVPLGLSIIDEAVVAGACDVNTGAELPQYPVGGQPGQHLAFEIGPVTAVGVSAGLLDHAGAHRVEMNVANQGEAVTISIDEKGLEAALEEVACLLSPRIDMARIAEGEVLHAGGEGLLARLESEVQMIGHQAKGMNLVAEATHAFFDQFIEPCAVFSAEEDVLTGVTAQDDVVEAAGHVQARFASHATRIVERRKLCN